MPVVDAHTHLWDVDRVHLSWFRDGLGLAARATVGDLEVAASAGGVSAALVVQAGDTPDEARWLLDHVAQSPLVRGVVLQYEPSVPAWAGAMQPILEQSGVTPVVGVRVATPSGAADLSDVPGLGMLAEGLARSGRVLELLVRPEQLPAVGILAEAHPGLAIVVCHLGLGAADARLGWQEATRALGHHPSVHAKISGLVTPDRTPGQLRTIVGSAADAFGPNRLMFGTDWPVSARFASYDALLGLTAAALPPWDAAEEHAFWSGTASRVYGL